MIVSVREMRHREGHVQVQGADKNEPYVPDQGYLYETRLGRDENRIQHEHFENARIRLAEVYGVEDLSLSEAVRLGAIVRDCMDRLTKLEAVLAEEDASSPRRRHILFDVADEATESWLMELYGFNGIERWDALKGLDEDDDTRRDQLIQTIREDLSFVREQCRLP